jgi:sugar-phosphatase
MIVQAILFDLDGTLVHSLEAVERAWGAWAQRVGLNPEEVVPTIHGRRALDSLAAWLPEGRDLAEEDAWLRQREVEDTEGITALPGARLLVDNLPIRQWGIVTSGTNDVATARIRAGGFRFPLVLVTGENVARGKPAPDPFTLGCARGRWEPTQVLVFEDTLAGMESARAAGCRAIHIGVDLPDFMCIRAIPQADGLKILGV